MFNWKRYWGKLEERAKFEIKLVFFGFLLTLMASIISGLLVGLIVYQTTLDKSPDIVVTVTEVNEGVIGFLVSNFADNPANNLIIYSYIKGIDNQPSSFAPPFFTLYKVSENISLDISYLDRQIALKAEEFLKNKKSGEIDYNSGNFILINPNDNQRSNFGSWAEKYNITEFPTLYEIQISATCKNCGNGDIIINSPIIYYWPIIECERVISFHCSVGNGELSWPTR